MSDRAFLYDIAPGQLAIYGRLRETEDVCAACAHPVTMTIGRATRPGGEITWSDETYCWFCHPWAGEVRTKKREWVANVRKVQAADDE